MSGPVEGTGGAAVGQEATPVKVKAVVRRLPGKARPREEALREYEELNAGRRKRIPPELWIFWAPDAREFYRWRVQLDCRCIKEVLVQGQDRRPDEGQWLDPVSGARLPAGQMFCSHDESGLGPYREIAEWGDRREITFPADPEEPPDYWSDTDMWTDMRHPEPHTSAFWKVTLSCGHVTEVCAPDCGWKPADGPRRVSARRQREMTDEFEEFWAENPDAENEEEREHRRRILAAGWPSPEPEQHCYACPRVRAIVACQRIGWLVPRPAEPKAPVQPSRAELERKLRQAEARAAGYRRQLAEMDTSDKRSTVD